MLDWHGSGMSVMEMSHRGKEFIAIHAEAEALLRELLAIPANYKVLFMQGGAIGENAIVPMNMLRGKAERRLHRHRRVVEEVDQGGEEVLPRSTSPPAPRRAASPASRRARPGSSTPTPPTCTSAPTRRSAASNTTGRPTPATCRWSPTCRATSCRGRSTSRSYGLIYGGAQKNIGPAGLTIVIVRDDLIGQAHADHALGLRLQAAGRQRLDAQHAADLRDLHRRPGVPAGSRRSGGLAAMAEHNRAKAAVLYDYLDRARSTATRSRAPTAR